MQESECDNCGEHALECKCAIIRERKWISKEEAKEMFPLESECEANAIEHECEPLCRRQQNGLGTDDNLLLFHKGKFFQNEEEFWKFSKEWPSMLTDQ